MPSQILPAVFGFLFSLSAFPALAELAPGNAAPQKVPLKIVIDQTTTRHDLETLQKDIRQLGYYLDIRQVKFDRNDNVETISGHLIAGYQCLSFDMKEVKGKVVIRQNEWGDILVMVGKS